jgi:oxysterol 7-alpha-hydroxylase
MIILIRSFDAEYEGLVDARGNKIQKRTALEVPPFDKGSGSAILHPTGDLLLRMKPRA